MEEKTTASRNSPTPLLSLLIAPLAVLLAIATIKIGGLTFEMNADNLMPMLVIGIAAIVGIVPRVAKDSGMFNISSSALSLASLGVAMVGHQAIVHLTDLGSFTALQFLVVAFGVYFFDSRGRHEIATILTFAFMGINVGLVAASTANTELVTIYQYEDGNFVQTLNLQRQALGYIFFSYLMIMSVLGLLIALLARGVINPEGQEGWFSKISSFEGNWNRSTLPLQIAAVVWILAHAGSLYHFESVSMADKLGLTRVEGYHGHFGFYGALFTGFVAMIVAGMAAERWYTRSMFIGSMWGLYLVSSWFEADIWTSEQLDGTWGSLIWLGITFFLCVGIYTISTHEKYGGWSNLDDHEASGARKFWDAHWSSMMIGLAFIFALVIRIQWYIVPSMNAFGTGNWDMTGGSDPWYMKRVVDYILANNAHLVFDADRAYPLGGVNPRPPLFTWSIAIVAMILEPMLGDDAVWYAILGLPAIYGALTIFPIATIAKDNFGKSAGVVAAWLIAFMPAHVSHSTWALADHDAFVMLFISMGFMFWFKAIQHSGNDRLTRTSAPNLGAIFSSFGVVAREKKSAMGHAILAGVSFGVASLAWKGFVVGPSILFLGYFLQVALNMFRRKDSTTLSALFLAMLFANLAMALPFYGHPQMDLIFDGTGLQPFLFVLGFTIAIAYVTTGFRDKPWLLVLGTLFVSAMVFFVILFVLKQLDISNAWDVLFTGSGYFAKNKIFGTIAEANAPDRGQLFAQLGPIVLVLALSMGFYCIWSSLRHKNQSHLFFGIWIFAATYMSWTAARFMFNATPAVAVMGAWGIIALWKRANWNGLVRTWKKFGIRTPADRITGARKAVWKTPAFSAIFLIMILLGGQQFTYGLDSAIPGTTDAEDEIDEKIYNVIPDALRWSFGGFSVLDSSVYDGNWYLGSFGSSFNDQGWNGAYEWLANQDAQMDYSQKPAFVSWWDYGFQAMNTGEHPSVSDNFQSGIPASGNMLLARSQADLVSMFIWQLSQGDLRYSQLNTGDYEMTNGFKSILDDHLTPEQYDLFIFIQEEMDNDKMKQKIDDYSFTVIQSNTATQVQENSHNVMASGYHRVNGIADTSQLFYRLYQNGEKLPCDPTVSFSCVDGDYSDYEEANYSFGTEIRSGQESTFDTTHYIFGDYWYTNDLRDEFSSVATHIHRTNTRLAMVTQLLSDALSEEQIVQLYDDLIGMEGYYHVQDYNGLPGDTISRDHEIRYFAIDNRLYPRAGRYTADYNYNGGQPMGIFGAPTILSGQDISTFMDEVYETSRGDRSFEMTREEVDEAMTNDFLDQQAGLDIDPLQVQDVRVDHNPEFFETMLARTYVGYGASSLGVDTAFSNPQPAQYFGQSGTPGSFLQQAIPMPGAMLNHFVIANWYDEDNNYSIGQANTFVKIMKYYSGAEISGQVVMSDNGNALPGVRLLIERDAFSGEGAEDLDEDTYWIPIGFTDADENGEWSFLAPAGRIRVSAFVGNFDPEPARATVSDGSFAQGINDVLATTNDAREVNAVTAILGNVANMTWLGETQMNVTGEQANRTADVDFEMDIEVQSSGVSGLLSWSGDESFDGNPIVETGITLKSVYGLSDDVVMTTTNGSFTTDETRIIQGTGEVEFTENGTFVSDGLASVVDFTGTFTRTISDKRTYVANGTWNGSGEIKASWIDLSNFESVSGCNVDANDATNITMPENQTLCLKDDTGDLPIYMLDGEIMADGRFTSDGTTVLTQELEGASFEGIGTFEGTGIFNGTGQFTGIGAFSGEMVNPGSFYQTGLVPGEYDVYANLDNGREIKLPNTVSIGLDPIYGLELTLPGSLITGNITSQDLEPIANATFEWLDTELEGATPVIVESDENGNYSYGPISAGNYSYKIDVDGDGFYEVNGTAIIGDESEVISPVSLIPDMFDLTIQLNSPLNETGVEVVDLNNNTYEIISISGLPTSTTAISNEQGVVTAELIPGEYQISDVNAEDFVLFETFEITDTDLEVDLTYSISTRVFGTMNAYTTEFNESWTQQDIEDNSTIASGVVITLESEGMFFTTETDVNGTFEVNIPGDRNFTMLAFNTLNNYGMGMIITPNNLTNYPLSDLYLHPLVTVTGQLYLYDNNSTWNQGFYDGYTPTISAENDDGVVWEAQTTPEGIFEFRLGKGEYDFYVEETEVNVTPLLNHFVSSNVSNSIINLTASPDEKQVSIQSFLDSADNESLEDGQLVSVDIQITSDLGDKEVISISADEFDSVGIKSLNLVPGTYTISVNSTLPSDENATDFNSFFISKQITVDLFDTEVQNFTIPLADERLFTGKLTYPDTENYSSEFLLYNEENDQWFNVETDANGNFSSYVPTGDWLIIIAPSDYDNKTYTLREALTIGEDSSLRTDKTLTMVEVMNVEFKLEEALTNEPIANARVTAVSQDGLGNVTLAASNETGNVSDILMPGTWNLFLDKSNLDTNWIINTTDTFSSSDVADGVVDLGVVSADVEVRIGGRVFWDINDDDIANLGEWVEGFNLTIVGTNNSDINTVITTDADGLWSTFVPIRDVYNITLEKAGYAITYYDTENETGFVVHDSSETRDIEVEAGSVTVSGTVTTSLADADSHLDGASIEIHPSSDVDRAIVIPQVSYDSETLSWSADLTPGDWVVIVNSASVDENGGGVAIGYLDATVLDGGELDLVMTSGGFVEGSTNWDDIELQSHHAGSSDPGFAMIKDSVEVSVDLNIGATWNVSVDSDGEFRILLPVGSTSLSSEFVTVQHERQLDMEYSVIANGDVEQGILDLQLNYARKLNSDSSMTLVESSIVNATDVNAMQMTAIVDGEDYKAIEMDLDVVYEGTETSDVFTVTGNVETAQGSELWTVEVFNGSDWVSETEITLGIGENLTDSTVDNQTTIRVRVLMPNVSSSWSLDDGHQVSVQLDSDAGLSSSTKFDVMTPQFYGFELSDVVEETGVSPGGQGSFSFIITNTGNGDDTYTIELADNLPEGWQITPTTSTPTITKGNFINQPFTIFAPESFTSGAIKATVTITSEDGITTEPIEVDILSARISLSVDEDLTQELTKVYESKPGQLVVPIENSGYKSAGSVIVYANITNDAGTKTIEELAPQTISIGPGQTTQAVFTLSESSEKFNRFAISVDVQGDDLDYVEDDISDFDFQEEVILDDTEPTSAWFMVIIIVLTLLVGYGGMKVARNKGSARF